VFYLYCKAMIQRLILFLFLNFGALALGGIFAGQGAVSDWYDLLNKAPWTPPGWVFGFAWTTIMICYSIFMALAWEKVQHKKKFILIFVVQWILNVVWNPSFFYFHQVLLGFIVICSLTALIAYVIIGYKNSLNSIVYFLLPYLIWLCIATSLNGYILAMN